MTLAELGWKRGAGSAVAFAAALACRDEIVSLELDGPERVEVRALGPVEAPELLLSDGSSPEGATWSSASPAVARVEAGGIRAVGPGETTVTAEWQGQHVSWVLVVRPAPALAFVDPPAALRVGERVSLVVRPVGEAGGPAPAELAWTSSNDAVLSVSGGVAEARAVGVAWVTAASPGAEAMLELRVEPADQGAGSASEP